MAAKKKHEMKPLPNMEELNKLLSKKFGGSTISIGSGSVAPIRKFSSGSLAVDYLLEGGFPYGRIVEILADPGIGKTTLAMNACAQAQKLATDPDSPFCGRYAVYIDAEHSFNPDHAAAAGIDMSKLIMVKPKNGEAAFHAATELVERGIVSVVVFDSVDAMIAAKDTAREVGDDQVGLRAKVMSVGIRRFNHLIDEGDRGTTAIFINQFRANVSGFGASKAGVGGSGLVYYASVRLEMKKTGDIKDGGEIVGMEGTVKSIKSKVSFPRRVVPFTIMWGTGLSYEADLVEFGQRAGIIGKSGAWYEIPEISLRAQGKANLMLSLEFDDKARNFVAEAVLHRQSCVNLLRDCGAYFAVPFDGRFYTLGEGMDYDLKNGAKYISENPDLEKTLRAKVKKKKESS